MFIVKRDFKVSMFSLIFYCVLISSVVSAHFNNDTLNVTIPVSKNCVLEMKENEISQIVELFNRGTVNVVDIHISFSNSSHEGKLFSDFHVSLSNPIGREILYVLKGPSYVTWTLKAGIRNYKLNVKGSQNDCIKTGKNATDFVLESTQHIVDSINLATNYEVCSSFKENSSGKVNEICCQMTKLNLAFKYGCSRGNLFLFKSSLPWQATVVFMYLAYFYLLWLLLVFLARTEFDSSYYKLEECTMSASFILPKIIWEENGPVVSLIRSLSLVSVPAYFIYLSFEKVYFFISIAVCALWVILYQVFRNSKNSSIFVAINSDRERSLQFLACYPCYTLRPKVKTGQFTTVVETLTLPFNIQLWSKEVKELYSWCGNNFSFEPNWLRQIASYVICFLFFCFSFPFLLIISSMYPVFRLVSLVVHVCALGYEFNWSCHIVCLLCLTIVLCVSVIVLLGFALHAIILALMSFLLGLFLNLIFYIPYIAFFSVLTFYCYSYWQTMEEKYFALKRLIYEECQKRQDNDGCIPEPNGKVLPVVSKSLYDQIRRELLPYNTNLFFFGLKMLWSIAFSFGIFKLIDILNEFNVTGIVQVVTTASLGIMPHILNMVALKTSEERKKAWDERFKLSIKYMVEELIEEDCALGGTILEIKQDDDTIIGFPSCVQSLRNLFVWNRPKNGDVEMLARTATAGGNHETTDENGQNSENAYDNVDGEDSDDIKDSEGQPLVQQNNDVIVKENHQNSGNAHDNVDGDDGRLTLIVHRNHETISDDMIVEENDQNSVLQSCTLS